jgi:hypothetical protein
MTDDTEVTVFPTLISGPRQKRHESGDGNCHPHDRHLTSCESRTDSARRSNATVRARRFSLALIQFHMRGSARLRDDDPCIQFGEIDADATLTGTWTHVNRGPVLRLAQASLQLRLRLMTDRALVRRRRTFVGDPHVSPHGTDSSRDWKKAASPATLMRLAAGAGREAQERIFIIPALVLARWRMAHAIRLVEHEVFEPAQLRVRTNSRIPLRRSGWT